jgi:hypothetical protein
MSSDIFSDDINYLDFFVQIPSPLISYIYSYGTLDTHFIYIYREREYAQTGRVYFSFCVFTRVCHLSKSSIKRLSKVLYIDLTIGGDAELW